MTAAATDAAHAARRAGFPQVIRRSGNVSEKRAERPSSLDGWQFIVQLNARLKMPRKRSRGPVQIFAEFREGKITEADAIKAMMNLLRKDGCPACYVTEDLYVKMVDERDHAVEACAKIAEEWEPSAPPPFNNLRLQSEVEQLDAKIRPIQIEVAKKIAKAIRERYE